MTAQKSKAATKAAVETAPTAEELVEDKIALEELLVDMPSLRKPERLRLRHKNALKTIGYRYQDRLGELGVEADDSGVSEITTEQALLMMDIAADIDEWAEGIADDPDAYVAWAEGKSDHPEVFLSIMSLYLGAVGESNGSAS